MPCPIGNTLLRWLPLSADGPVGRVSLLLTHLCRLQRASPSRHRTLFTSVQPMKNRQSSPGRLFPSMQATNGRSSPSRHKSVSTSKQPKSSSRSSSKPRKPKSCKIPRSPVTGLRTIAIDCEMVETKESQLSLASDVADRTLTNEGNPLPHRDSKAGQSGGEVPSKITSTPRQKLLSLVGRCSIVDYNGRSLFDKYIDPRRTFKSNYIITNYRTRYSGITEKHMKRAVPFNKARQQVLDIIKNTVLIGHTITNDLNALRISDCHATSSIKDTGTHRSLREMAGLNDDHSQVSLKKLSKVLLNRDIQMSKGKRHGHCSLEDARATMDLYKLAEKNWNGKSCSASKDEEGHSASKDKEGCSASKDEEGCSASKDEEGCSASKDEEGWSASKDEEGCSASKDEEGCSASKDEEGCSASKDEEGWSASKDEEGCSASKDEEGCSASKDSSSEKVHGVS